MKVSACGRSPQANRSGKNRINTGRDRGGRGRGERRHFDISTCSPTHTHTHTHTHTQLTEESVPYEGEDAGVVEVEAVCTERRETVNLLQSHVDAEPDHSHQHKVERSTGGCYPVLALSIMIYTYSRKTD